MESKTIFKNLEKRQEVIIYTNHGTQYKALEYISLCYKYNVKRSLLRVGKSIDNGLVESIFERIKNEFCRNKRIKCKNANDFVDRLNSFIN